ncbi:MAG: efflux RND transporter periplasmic adaptor subunit [Bryobacteraceae bacterium]|jgi:RND family efflux transporter MFP subunit
MRTQLVGLAAVVAIAWLGSSCSKPGIGATRGPQAPDILTVAVAQAQSRDLSQGIVVTAEFRPFQEVDVMAKVAGYIQRINVDVGDRVREGELLATLEVPEMQDDLRRSNAALELSNAGVARAKDEVQSDESAHEMVHVVYQRLAAVAAKRPGLVAQQEIDDARGKDLVAEAQVSAAQSALAAATEQMHVSQAETQKIKTLMDYTRVTAPFAGVVTKRFADTGSMIQAGTASQTQAMPVVRLSENSLLRLILPVPESAVPTVHIGQQVEVQVPTLNRSFPGKVARFADKLSLATRTMDTEVDVPNADLVLIPGMFAEVNLTLADRRGVVAVPVTAVDRDAPGASGSGESTGRVMIVTPNDRVAVRRISLGIENANSVEVRSGLNQGDLVVISGRSSLQAGEEVRPKIATLTAAVAE